MTGPVFNRAEHLDPEATRWGPTVATVALSTLVLALFAGPAVLTIGAVAGVAVAARTAGGRARRGLVPWLLRRQHPLARQIPDGLSVHHPSLRPWLKPVPVGSLRWSPVLTGLRSGRAVSLGADWVAVDLGHLVPRLDVPLSRERFWRHILGHQGRPNVHRDTVFIDVFGEHSSAWTLPDPIIGQDAIASVLRPTTAGQPSILGGHLVLGRAASEPPEESIERAVSLALSIEQQLESPNQDCLNQHQLIRAGSAQRGDRIVTGTTAAGTVILRDAPRTPQPHVRVNGPQLSVLASRIARMDPGGKSLGAPARIASRWSSLFAWDDRVLRLTIDLGPTPLPPGLRVTGPFIEAGAPLGHPVLSALLRVHGTETPQSLTTPQAVDALATLAAMTPALDLTATTTTTLQLDLPLMAGERSSDALDAAATLRRCLSTAG